MFSNYICDFVLPHLSWYFITGEKHYFNDISTTHTTYMKSVFSFFCFVKYSPRQEMIQIKFVQYTELSI